MSMEDAYGVQSLLLELRLQSGQRRIGWKLGYTSEAMRKQMGVDRPNFGPLTSSMVIRNGDEVPESLLQPRVEPEVGIMLSRPLEPRASRAAALSCVGAAYACLEVVDSVYADYRFRVEDNTADGSSAAGVVIGPKLTTGRLDELGVVMSLNGTIAHCAAGAAASGHPIDGIVWLAGALAAQGERLQAGDLIITGGLTASVPLGSGSCVEATFGDGSAVFVRRRSAS